MTDNTELANKIVSDIGDNISWAARPEVTRTIKKTLDESEREFLRLNEESYRKGGIER